MIWYFIVGVLVSFAMWWETEDEPTIRRIGYFIVFTLIWPVIFLMWLLFVLSCLCSDLSR